MSKRKSEPIVDLQQMNPELFLNFSQIQGNKKGFTASIRRKEELAALSSDLEEINKIQEMNGGKLSKEQVIAKDYGKSLKDSLENQQRRKSRRKKRPSSKSKMKKNEETGINMDTDILSDTTNGMQVDVQIFLHTTDSECMHTTEE